MGDFDCDPDRRAELKKDKGNEEFKGGNIPQAVACLSHSFSRFFVRFSRFAACSSVCLCDMFSQVHYTESLFIKSVASVHANRAACYLSLKHHQKVPPAPLNPASC
jgi:hypothetical protein